MSESETLRPAAPDDAAAVAALTDAAYGKFVPRIGRSPMPMTFDYARVIAEHPVWVIDGTDGPCAVSGLALCRKQYTRRGRRKAAGNIDY